MAVCGSEQVRSCCVSRATHLTCRPSDGRLVHRFAPCMPTGKASCGWQPSNTWPKSPTVNWCILRSTVSFRDALIASHRFQVTDWSCTTSIVDFYDGNTADLKKCPF